jgi:hypothetical protein
MLTILGRDDGNRASFCDRISRRSFLRIGSLAVGGAAMGGATLGDVSLARLLAAEAQAGVGRSHKAIINVFLPGGPPHQDMWDIKLDAPAERPTCPGSKSASCSRGWPA